MDEVLSTTFQLRVPVSELRSLAARYSYKGEDRIIGEVVPRIRVAGCLSTADLVELGTWKSPRIRSRVASNSDELTTEATRVALSTNSEELRIKVLLALFGVGWPVASVILHLCHCEDYPILDFRALWSLQTPVPKQYTFEFWNAYTACCRRLAQKHSLSMRDLDRALWQYSKENA